MDNYYRLSPEEEHEKCRRIHFKNQLARAHMNVYNNLKTPYINYNGTLYNPQIIKQQEEKIKYKMSHSFHHNY